MLTSLQTMNPATNTLKQRARPGLKLNTCQKAFGEENIVVSMNSTASYVVENHPRYTDQSEFSFSTQKKYDQIFFTNIVPPESFGDCSYIGESYYVVQKSNGKEMQDRYKIRDPEGSGDIAFFGVYDGHTTHLIAEVLANKLDEYIVENLKSMSEIQNAIHQGFMALETEVLANLQDHKPRGGSTALCTILHNRRLYSGNLGDSQAVVFRGQNVFRLSNLHDFSNEREKMSVEQKGGTILRNRLQGELAVSRSIGDINFKAYMNNEPEISVYDLNNDDEYLFLATDGFWNGLSPEMCLVKIEEFRRSENYSTSLKTLGDFLVEEAKGNIKTKKDNMTLIIVDLRAMIQKKTKKTFEFSGFF